MSSKRAGDMAAIDAALSAPALPLESGSSAGSSSPIDTVVAPMPGTPTIIQTDDDLSDFMRGIRPLKEATLEQRRRIADLREAQKQEEDDLTAQQQALTAQQQEEMQLQARQSSLAQRGLASAWGAVNSVKNGIGSIAMPGGLATPIITFLILFFLIIQVNGKTRANWLWLALTNNAFVDSKTDSSGSSGSSGSDNTGSSGNNNAIPPGTFETPGTGAGGFGGGSSGDFGSTSAFVSMQQEFV